jgi:tetratricopeptide (TPR) repeat protein
MKKHAYSHFVFLTCVLSAIPVTAQNYVGASAVLREVQEANAKPGEKDEHADEQTKLRNELKQFSQTVSNLPPAEAAQRWLELVDRAAKIRQQVVANPNPMSSPIQGAVVLEALPPPADWSELAKAIAARPPGKGSQEPVELGLRFLADALTGDIEGRKRETATLQARAKNSDQQAAMFYRMILQQLSVSLLASSTDPDVIVKSLERQLDAAREQGMAQPLVVPNLVSEVGPEKAEAFLRKALTESEAQLTFETPNETSRLAQRLAVELMDKMKSPQWGLVNSLDSIELYEAIQKRFATETTKAPAVPGMPDVDIPTDNMGMTPKVKAEVHYMLGLIAKDRSKDAVVVAKELGGQIGLFMPENAFQAMERAGYASALDSFFYELLSQDPALPFWDQYVPLAAQAGQTDRMLALARAAAARDDIGNNKKAAIQQVLFKALLAADQVDEGVVEMRKWMATDDSTTPGFGNGYNFGNGYSKGQLGVLLAQIGELTQKPEWTQEGIDIAKSWLRQSSGQAQLQWESTPVLSSLAEILVRLNRGPEAETVLSETLARSVRLEKSQPQYAYNPGMSQTTLKEMAKLYHSAGREADVLVLLEESPDWGAKDLSDLSDSSMFDQGVALMQIHTASSSLPIAYLAANALIASGQKGKAARIVDDLLNRQPGLDRGYELLLALKGTDAIPRLNELFALDPFEERPLIWKAHLLRQKNQLEEAEKAVRQAIAIDPSDGEEGRGDRMRAYAELADIREARGDQKEAGFYREVVKAIRTSEDADRFYAAGLLKRAVAMYEEGLTHFADAYCIQSRLAIQLSALGKNQEAEDHYRRAYELMPDSFGRVESHCFGCERVFTGERAQSIAEKVFTKLVAERPDKPQVHYLLGYLREEQERFNEARTNYMDAVRLDPDYLNAWGKLEGIGEHVLMSPKERDQIVFSILRLDPMQRHQHPRLDEVTDLAGLWNVIEAGSHRYAAPATNLFTLTASKAALEKRESDPAANAMQIQMMQQVRMRSGQITPAGAVAQTPFVALAGQLMFNDYGMMNDL